MNITDIRIKAAGALLFLTHFLYSCTAGEIIETQNALNAYQEGKYLTAITYSTEALKTDPSSYEAMMIRGKSNLKLGNYKESIKDFSAVLGKKKYFDPYYYRARACLEINELESAEADMESALKFNSGNVNALFDLAYIRTLLGEYESASEVYKLVIQIDPANSNAYVNLGNLKGRMGESEEAIGYFSKAISLKPDDALAYFNRAAEKLISNDKHGAIEDLSVSVLIDSVNVNSHFLLAETYLQIKDYINAHKYLTKILFLDNQNARAYYLRGTVELYMKENEKACNDLRKAGELGYYDAYELITKNCTKKEKKKSNRR